MAVHLVHAETDRGRRSGDPLAQRPAPDGPLHHGAQDRAPAPTRPTFFLSLYWIDYAADAEPGSRRLPLEPRQSTAASRSRRSLTDNLAIAERARPPAAPRPMAAGRSRPDRPDVRQLPARHLARLGDLVPDRVPRTLIVRRAGRPVGRRSTRPADGARATRTITTMLTERIVPSATVNGIRPARRRRSRTRSGRRGSATSGAPASSASARPSTRPRGAPDS